MTMGLFGSIFSSSSESKADKKKRLRAQYDSQIAGVQMSIDNHKNNLANAQWQLKRTKDQSHKRTIENEKGYIKQLQEQLRRIKADKAATLKNI